MKSFVHERDRELVLSLAIGRIDERQFLAAFDGDPRHRAVEWLQRSVQELDGLGAELALILGYMFGFEDVSLCSLQQLAGADWHKCHEDVVGALAKFAAPESVDVLYQAAVARFPYRDYDESQSLGVKCVRALAKIGTVRAVGRLRELVESGDPILADKSTKMLNRLAKESDSDEVRDAAERALT